MLQYLAICISLLLSFNVWASKPLAHEEWYLVKNGMAVKSIENNQYLKLHYVNGEVENLYLIDTSQGCKQKQEIQELEAPFRFNDVFVNYSKTCSASETLYFPTTQAGLEHIISKLKVDNSTVKIASYDKSLNFTFTTVRFQRIFEIKELMKKVTDNLDQKAEILREEQKILLEQAKKEAL